MCPADAAQAVFRMTCCRFPPFGWLDTLQRTAAILSACDANRRPVGQSEDLKSFLRSLQDVDTSGMTPFVTLLHFLQSIFSGQALDVFKQGHAEEVSNLAGTPESVLLVKVNCTLERLCGIEADPLAVTFSKPGFRAYQQPCRNASTVPSGQDRHSSNVAFVLAYDIARDRANDLTGIIGGDKYKHLFKTTRDALRCEHRIKISGGGIPVLVLLECGAQATKNARRVALRRLAYRPCNRIHQYVHDFAARGNSSINRTGGLTRSTLARPRQRQLWVDFGRVFPRSREQARLGARRGIQQ